MQNIKANETHPALQTTPPKGLPGDSCSFYDVCISGLTCSLNQCKCPSPCLFVSDRGGCDCGEAHLGFPNAALVVGLVLSILSCIFWIWLIRRTYRRMRDKYDDEFDNPVEDATEPQINLPYESQAVRIEDKVALSNDPPPSYSSVMNSNPTIGFVLPATTADMPYNTTVPPVNPFSTNENIPLTNSASNIAIPPYPLYTQVPSAPNFNLDSALSNENSSPVNLFSTNENKPSTNSFSNVKMPPYLLSTEVPSAPNLISDPVLSNENSSTNPFATQALSTNENAHKSGTSLPYSISPLSAPKTISNDQFSTAL